MLIEHLKSSRNGLLVAALVMSLGGVGAAQSAETGVSPPPLKAPPVLPGAKPAVPMTCLLYTSINVVGDVAALAVSKGGRRHD